MEEDCNEVASPANPAPGNRVTRDGVSTKASREHGDDTVSDLPMIEALLALSDRPCLKRGVQNEDLPMPKKRRIILKAQPTWTIYYHVVAQNQQEFNFQIKVNGTIVFRIVAKDDQIISMVDNAIFAEFWIGPDSKGFQRPHVSIAFSQRANATVEIQRHFCIEYRRTFTEIQDAWSFHKRLMESGDVEKNPGPNPRGPKGKGKKTTRQKKKEKAVSENISDPTLDNQEPEDGISKMMKDTKTRKAKFENVKYPDPDDRERGVITKHNTEAQVYGSRHALVLTKNKVKEEELNESLFDKEAEIKKFKLESQLRQLQYEEELKVLQRKIEMQKMRHTLASLGDEQDLQSVKTDIERQKLRLQGAEMDDDADIRKTERLVKRNKLMSEVKLLTDNEAAQDRMKDTDHFSLVCRTVSMTQASLRRKHFLKRACLRTFSNDGSVETPWFESPWASNDNDPRINYCGQDLWYEYLDPSSSSSGDDSSSSSSGDDSSSSDEPEAELDPLNIVENERRAYLNPNPGLLSFKLSTLPREFWESYLPKNRIFAREGRIVDWMHYVSIYGDPYDNVADVSLYGYVIAVLQDGIDNRPWRDREEEARDLRVAMVQPMIRITFMDGSFLHYAVDFNLNNENRFKPEFNLKNLLHSGITTWFKAQPSLDSIRDLQYFKRFDIEFQDDVIVAFKPIFVSTYLVNELYSRRTILTPGLSTPTQVERLIRIAAEDSVTSTHVVFRMRGSDVLMDTASFLAAVITGNGTTALKDF